MIGSYIIIQACPDWKRPCWSLQTFSRGTPEDAKQAMVDAFVNHIEGCIDWAGQEEINEEIAFYEPLLEETDQVICEKIHQKIQEREESYMDNACLELFFLSDDNKMINLDDDYSIYRQVVCKLLNSLKTFTAK